MKIIEKLRYRRFILWLTDVFIYVFFGTMLLTIDKQSFLHSTIAIVLLMACVFLTRIVNNVYAQVWRYATSGAFMKFIVNDFIGGCIYLLVSQALPLAMRIMFWQAIAIVAVSCLASVFARYVYQYRYKNRNNIPLTEDEMKKNGETNQRQGKADVAIVGAGSAGFYLASELQMNKMSMFEPCLFIDRDKEKIGKFVCGLRVYPPEGIVEKLRELNVRDVILALPGLDGEKRQALFDFYTNNGFRVKLYELPFIDGNSSGTDYGAEYDKSKEPVLRDFKIEDLLFREPIKINNAKTSVYYKNKVVLITGGGGSIGSEICRQIAKFSPKKLIILDIYENNAYDIQQELKVKYGTKLNVAVEIISVCERKCVDEIMERYKPDVVIHAAAHKHVPLMEHNCAEAVKNNVFGTLNVVNASEKYNVKKFILISTDKAVNPTNIMGATKRMCEMIVQSRSDRSENIKSATKFMAVRFGNVLGSNGSVIPLFKRQIANGGPITITDKRIIRYFMTIPEAAQLVLEAGSIANDGELFVLDMGKPVKILKLAEDLIRLSGLKPYKDIDIEEIGLREGEKLYEELLVKSEQLVKTGNDMIFIEKDRGLSRTKIAEKLGTLQFAAQDGNPQTVKKAMKETVPTYHEPMEVNDKVTCEKKQKEALEFESLSVKAVSQS